MTKSRCLKIYPTWMLHQLRVEGFDHVCLIEALEKSGFKKVGIDFKEFNTHQDERIFLGIHQFLLVINHKITYLFFKNKEDAFLARERIGGKYRLIPQSESPFLNIPIPRKFTLKFVI